MKEPMKPLILILCAALAGCATGDYAKYTEAQAKVESARYAADAAKYRAMSEIAAGGSESAKVAAVVALALGQGGAQAAPSQVKAPESHGGTLLQWAGSCHPLHHLALRRSIQKVLGNLQGDLVLPVSLETSWC